jgi:transcriptional regulator with XRE-family HTH domain
MKQNVDAHVGKRLKQRRTMMGLSQEAVAKSAGITFQQVQKYEKGSNAMNASRLHEMANFMNVPVAYFFEGLGKKPVIHEQITGFAESPVLTFDHTGADSNINIASDREALEMMKSFNRIKEPLIRKRLADLLRAIAENKAILD